MKEDDLKHIMSDYELFNVILFNNSLPRANKIDFKLHNFTFAAGYSKYNEIPSKTGNQHEIAFCKFYKFSNKEIQEILIHEMIHLWQAYSVKLDRYKICSNDIAHDRVFTGKMNTINLILQQKGYDLKISETWNSKLYLDMIDSKTYHYIVFFEDEYNNHYFAKTTIKGFSKFIKECIDKSSNFKNIYAIKSKSYIYNLLESNSKYLGTLQKSIHPDTGKDLYDSNNAEIWILKDNKKIYEI